jgi:hypothetical protein
MSVVGKENFSIYELEHAGMLMYSLVYRSILPYALACNVYQLQLFSNVSCSWTKSRCADGV